MVISPGLGKGPMSGTSGAVGCVSGRAGTPPTHSLRRAAVHGNGAVAEGSLSHHVIFELHSVPQEAWEFKRNAPSRFGEGARVKRKSGRQDTVRIFYRQR